MLTLITSTRIDAIHMKVTPNSRGNTCLEILQELVLCTPFFLNYKSLYKFLKTSKYLKLNQNYIEN